MQAQASGPVAHPDVWKDSIVFHEEVTVPDGNVYVVSDHVAFCVHKSGLVRVSEVFRNLFSLPPAPDNTDTLHGLPYVRVWDDPEDLAHLLLVVCCGKK